MSACCVSLFVEFYFFLVFGAPLFLQTLYFCIFTKRLHIVAIQRCQLFKKLSSPHLHYACQSFFHISKYHTHIRICSSNTLPCGVKIVLCNNTRLALYYLRNARPIFFGIFLFTLFRPYFFLLNAKREITTQYPKRANRTNEQNTYTCSLTYAASSIINSACCCT